MDVHPMGMPARAGPRKDAIRLPGLVWSCKGRDKAGVAGAGW